MSEPATCCADAACHQCPLHRVAGVSACVARTTSHQHSAESAASPSASLQVLVTQKQHSHLDKHAGSGLLHSSGAPSPAWLSIRIPVCIAAPAPAPAPAAVPAPVVVKRPVTPLGGYQRSWHQTSCRCSTNITAREMRSSRSYQASSAGCSDVMCQSCYSLSCKHTHARNRRAEHPSMRCDAKAARALSTPVKTQPQSKPRVPRSNSAHLLLAARAAAPQGRQGRRTQGPPTGHQAARHAVQPAPRHLARAAQR
jgi:hypothetical protein